MLQLGEQLLNKCLFTGLSITKNQLALSAGDHRRTFQLLNDFLGKIQC